MNYKGHQETLIVIQGQSAVINIMNGAFKNLQGTIVIVSEEHIFCTSSSYLSYFV